MKDLFRRICTGRRGIAMIIVLMVVTVLTVLILDLHQSVRIHFYIATNLVDGIKASYLVRSGVQVAAGALLNDIQDNNVDHWHEDWYDFLGKLGMPGIPISNDETLLMQINDESGRFNLNNLIGRTGAANTKNVEILANLLQNEELDPQIANAIADYIDADEETLDGNGMENSVYGYDAMTDGPKSKNSRFDSIQEVRLVAGVTDDVWAKIEPLVTIYGDPKMNLNTVSVKVMKAVIKTVDPNADPAVADKIDQWRKTSAAGEGDNAFAALTSGEGNYFKPKEMLKVLTGDIGMEPKLAAGFVRYFGVTSHFFRVDTTALVRGVQKNAVGIIFRMKKKSRIIYYRVAPGVSAVNMEGNALDSSETTPGALPAIGTSAGVGTTTQ